MRRKTPFPSHINREKLPPNVFFDQRGDGRWLYRKQVCGTRKETFLGSASMTLGEIHTAAEKLLAGPMDTFKSISSSFLGSREFQALKPRTQKGYRAIHDYICRRETKAGLKLGDIPIDSWTVGAVRRYREARRLESESGAAADLRYIKRVFSWAVEYEFMDSNPAQPVSLRGMTKGSRRYVTDEELFAAICLAPFKLALIMYFAYLTGRRRTDILDATRRQLTDDGVYFAESKTDKECTVGWTKELSEVVDLIRETSGGSMYLFPADGRPDIRYSDSAMDNAMQKLRRQMIKAGHEPFRFKDLRKKYSTDIEAQGEDAQRNLMHGSRSTTDRSYVSRPTKVVSIGKKKEKVAGKVAGKE